MHKTKTLVKICGLTSIDQAVQVAQLGTNAIGIISVKESPRYISPEKKKEIFKTLKVSYPNIERVSVVKNMPIDSIIKNYSGEGNDTIIQLHGDEDIDYCQKLKQKIPNIGLWKAFRIKNKTDDDDDDDADDVDDDDRISIDFTCSNWCSIVFICCHRIYIASF